MGNRFGNYQTTAEAENALVASGFTKAPTGDYFTKPSTDAFGFPTTAMVEVTSGFVASRYTASGKDEIYYQHHYLN